MKQTAFTLLETIIVLAIITMFFAISIPLFSRLTESAKLDTSARSIASVLRTARGYAISSNQDCDVRFNDPNLGDYQVFGYISPGVTGIIDKIYKLPTGIKFDNIIGFTGSIARFSSTGMLDEDDDASIDVTDGDNFITITVERTTGRARIED